MSDDLYFMRLIIEAAEDPDPQWALKAAFQQIEQMGREPRYRRGYLQFQSFVEKVVRYSTPRQERRARLEKDLVQALTIEVAAEVLEADPDEERLALKTIRSHPRWLDEYESWHSQFREFPRPARGATILVVREGRPVGTMVLLTIPGSSSIGGLIPGGYSVVLETGRLLWEGKLTDRDLLWSKAFPGQDLDLAAKTDGFPVEPSKEVLLLDGELILRIVPGVEAGKMELEARAFGVS